MTFLKSQKHAAIGCILYNCMMRHSIFLIKVLKALRFSAVLIFIKGRSFQILGPQEPNVTWFVLGIFKFNFIFFPGNSVIFLYFNFFFHEIGIQTINSFIYFITYESYLLQVHVSFSSSCSYEFSQSFRRNLRARLCKLSIYLVNFYVRTSIKAGSSYRKWEKAEKEKNKKIKEN